MTGFLKKLPALPITFGSGNFDSRIRMTVCLMFRRFISPSFSIHSGVGTSNYSFIWGMGGENQVFDDMDSLNLDNIK